MQNWVYLYFAPFLLNRIGKLLAYVAALLVTSVCRVADWIVRGAQNLLIAVNRRFES